MAILPVTYVRGTTKNFGQAGDSVFGSSQDEFNVSAISSDDVNPLLLWTFHGHDARTTSTDPLTVWTTDFATQDTDWKIVWSAGANLVSEPGFVYMKANPPVAVGYAVGWRLDGTGMVGGRFHSAVFKNARQLPSCDVVVPNTDAQTAHSTTTPHSYTIAPYSSDAAWLVYGCNAYYSQDLPAFTPDTDMTEIVDGSVAFGGSDEFGVRSMLGWGNRDTDWTVLKVNFSASAEQTTRTAVFQIYPYEVVLSDLAGTLTFIGDVDRKISLTRFFAGTLSFTQGVLVTLKRWKVWTTAIIRMWLEPQSDDIELDVSPKGFTDIGES